MIFYTFFSKLIEYMVFFQLSGTTLNFKSIFNFRLLYLKVLKIY